MYFEVDINVYLLCFSFEDDAFIEIPTDRAEASRLRFYNIDYYWLDSTKHRLDRLVNWH